MAKGTKPAGRRAGGKAGGGVAGKRRPGLETLLVHGGTLRTEFGETSEALFLNSGYVYETAELAERRFKGDEAGFVYSRFSNPTLAMFEGRMCALEGAQAARATATGMAAVTAALSCQVRAGDHVVAARALFGSCRYVVEELMPRFGVDFTLVDGGDLGQWRKAMRPNTKVLFLESPTNPTLEVYDIAAIASIAHQAGARLVVDNVFATPLHQRPLALGADVIVYSATKHIDGQGRCLGGVILSSQGFVDEHLHNFMRQTGPSMSPFNAWVLLKGLETLHVRVARHCETAARIADFLAGHRKVTRVLYPGRADHPQARLAKRQMTAGGPMLAFEVAGSKRAAFRFCNGLDIIRISNNLGDAKSLITHPATTTHQRIGAPARAELGISDAMLRLSVGLEAADDLIGDIDAALKRV